MADGGTGSAVGSEDIGVRIDSTYAQLSRSEQRAADFILDHVDDLAVFSATELAQHSGVSKATVSRLFRRLGFTSAQEVRDQARALRYQGVPLGPAGAGSSLQLHLEREQANLARMTRSLAGGVLEDVTKLLADAREVVVLGQRNSYPLALHLRQQLAQARDRVRLAPQPGQSVGEDLAGLGHRDAVVVLGFRRRPAGFAAQLTALESLEVPVVLIADGSARRYAARVAHVVECPVDSDSALDSYAAAMSLAHLLATGVLGRHLSAGRARIASINALYADLDELESAP